jgi:uncharacterized iron-regulated membrane protein
MRSRVKKVLFWTHLAGGLTVALPILVMCVTGILMMYEAEIQAGMDRWGVKSHPPAAGAQALSIETLILKTRQAVGVNPSLITVFAGSTQPVEVRLNRRRPGSLYLDVYNGAVIGEPSRKMRQFFSSVKAWHAALGVRGAHARQFRAFVMAANMAGLFVAISGIWLWLPRRLWRLCSIIFPRWSLTGRARDFNWHNSIGIWSAIPILVIAWTGVAMSYGWANRLTSRIIGTPSTERREEWTASTARTAESRTISLDALFLRAKQQSAQWKAITMEVPHRDSDHVDFAIDMSGYNGIGKSSALRLDRAGNVVFFAPAGSDGLAASSFIRNGHTGEAWGVAGQTIAGAASLGRAVVVWSGVALSLRRLRRRSSTYVVDRPV